MPASAGAAGDRSPPHATASATHASDTTLSCREEPVGRERIVIRREYARSLTKNSSVLLRLGFSLRRRGDTGTRSHCEHETSPGDGGTPPERCFSRSSRSRARANAGQRDGWTRGRAEPRTHPWMGRITMSASRSMARRAPTFNVFPSRRNSFRGERTLRS